MDAEIAREAERKREIMERSPFAAEHKRRRELSEQGFSFAEATAKLVEEHAAASIAPPNDVPDGGDDDASKASQGGWWQGCGAAYSISCVGSVTTRGAASGRRPSEITIGTDADASRGTIL